jgi:hypothetical protein
MSRFVRPSPAKRMICASRRVSRSTVSLLAVARPSRPWRDNWRRAASAYPSAPIAAAISIAVRVSPARPSVGPHGAAHHRREGGRGPAPCGLEYSGGDGRLLVGAPWHRPCPPGRGSALRRRSPRPGSGLCGDGQPLERPAATAGWSVRTAASTTSTTSTTPTRRNGESVVVGVLRSASCAAVTTGKSPRRCAAPLPAGSTRVSPMPSPRETQVLAGSRDEDRGLDLATRGSPRAPGRRRAAAAFPSPRQQLRFRGRRRVSEPRHR